MEPLKY